MCYKLNKSSRAGGRAGGQMNIMARQTSDSAFARYNTIF